MEIDTFHEHNFPKVGMLAFVEFKVSYYDVAVQQNYYYTPLNPTPNVYMHECTYVLTNPFARRDVVQGLFIIRS